MLAGAGFCRQGSGAAGSVSTMAARWLLLTLVVAQLVASLHGVPCMRGHPESAEVTPGERERERWQERNSARLYILTAAGAATPRRGPHKQGKQYQIPISNRPVIPVKD